MPILKTDAPRAQWLFLLAALLIIGGMIGLNLYDERNDLDTLERERLAAQARIIGENIGRQLQAINLVLHSIRGDVATLQGQKDGRTLLNRRLRALSGAMPGVRTLGILDVGGTITASNREELIGRNFRERDYFQGVRASRDPALLHVSPPFSTILGVFGMNLSKVVLTEGEQFAGVVTATLDPEYFKMLLESIRYAPQVWSYLAHGNGKLFLMVPTQPGVDVIGFDKPGGFRNRHLASGRKDTVMTGYFHAEGEEHMVAQRTIKPDYLPLDAGLEVAVARDLPGIFAIWKRDAYVWVGLFSLLALASILGLFFYQQRYLAYKTLIEAQEAERRRAQVELQASEMRFRSLLQEIPSVAVQGCSREGTVLYWNQASALLYGYQAEEAIGRNLLDLIIPREMHQCVTEAMRQVFESGRTIPTGECTRKRKNGSMVSVISSHAYVQVPGKVPEMFYVDIDLSDRKHAEDRLRSTNADLQRFAEVTAHHLQEPARRMASYAERLAEQLGDRLDDAEARLSLEFIGQQAHRQQHLLRDVERYLASAQPRGEVGTVDAGRVAAALLARSAERISAQGAEITLGDLPPARIDRPRLDDVFSVALDNALIHAGCAQPLRIVISGERRDGVVRYSVTDNGPGIEEQYRERVFRIFERLSSSQAGTGIGLAILRRVAENCGGRAWLEDAPGGGCRLLFELPAGEPGEPT